MSEASVTIDRTELQRALKGIRKFIKPKKFPEAAFRLKDNLLSIEAGGLEIGVPAEGDWPGVAMVSSSYLLTLAKALPSDDPLPVRVESNRLFVSNFSTLCIWKQKVIRTIELPMDAPLTMILALRLKYSDEEIGNSGFTSAVQVAEAHRDNLLERVVEILKPLEVEYSDLKIAVDTCLRRKEKL